MASNCTICNTDIQGYYCSNCGQKVGKKPVRIISMISDFFTNLLSLERSVFATLIALIIKPKFVVLNYYNGNKNYYAGPGKFLFYSIIVVALHATYVNPQILGVNFETEQVESQHLFWLFSLPILVFMSYLAFLRTHKKIAIHVVATLYLGAAFLMLFTLIFDSINYFLVHTIGPLQYLIFLICLFIYNALVLSRSRKLMFILANTFLQLIVFTALFGLIVLIMYWVNPGTVQFN